MGKCCYCCSRFVLIFCAVMAMLATLEQTRQYEGIIAKIRSLEDRYDEEANGHSVLCPDETLPLDWETKKLSKRCARIYDADEGMDEFFSSIDEGNSYEKIDEKRLKNDYGCKEVYVERDMDDYTVNTYYGCDCKRDIDDVTLGDDFRDNIPASEGDVNTCREIRRMCNDGCTPLEKKRFSKAGSLFRVVLRFLMFFDVLCKVIVVVVIVTRGRIVDPSKWQFIACFHVGDHVGDVKALIVVFIIIYGVSKCLRREVEICYSSEIKILVNDITRKFKALLFPVSIEVGATWLVVAFKFCTGMDFAGNGGYTDNTSSFAVTRAGLNDAEEYDKPKDSVTYAADL